MAVFRSLNHIYVQVIDDSRGHTVAAASSLEPAIRGNVNNGTRKSEVSAMVGTLIAERATEQGVKGVVFDRGGVRSFPPGYLGEHSTVHALTIHKSQGSQFGEVVVSLPLESSRLLTRELLYTAVTRASKRVTVVGPESAIRLGIERSVQRASGLRSRLWG